MKNALSKMFGTDRKIEKSGVILQYDNFRLRIARAGGANEKYLKTLDLVSKPYQRAIKHGNISPKLADKIMYEVYAKSVVLGWETNVAEEEEPENWQPIALDAEDNQMPFTWENCVKLFKDFPALFNDVKEQAEGLALWKKEILDEEAKNLQPSSDTV